MNSKIRLGGLVAAIAIFAAACGGGATPSPAESAAPSEGASAAPSEPAGEVLSGSLTLWNAYASGGASEGEAFNQILASAAEQFPDLEITALDVPFGDLYTKFETEAATGGGPDLFIAPNDNLGNEVRASLLVDVTAPWEASENAANTLEVANNGSRVDGKLYMIPESLKAVAMFYDKSKVTTPPATTDELLEAVKGGLAFGINQNPYHNWGFYSAFGGQIMDETGKCVADQGGVADAFQFLADLKAAGAQFYTDGAKFQDDFKTGKLAAIIEGPWFSGDAV
jgi:arabinogalactan oligomer/maltooligosaccharide transport system substrate-binding protein